MFPPYLSTEGLAIRAMVAGDARTAARWFPGPFPVGAEAAGRWLTAQHRMSPWDDPAHLWLVIVRPATGGVGNDQSPDDVVGSVRVGSPRARTPTVTVHVAPALTPDDADRIQAGVIRVVVAWLRDELGAMVVTLGIGSDQPGSIAAAEGLGMVRAARLREHLARPGRRVDLIWYQALGPAPRIAAPGADDVGTTRGQP